MTKRLRGPARVVGVFIVLGVVGLCAFVAAKAVLFVVDNW